MFGTSGLIGMAVGPLVAEPILENYGFSAFFFIASGLAAAALILQAPIKDKHHLQEENPPKSPSFFSLLKTRKQLVCGGLAVLFGFGLAATGSFIAPFAEARNLGYISLYYLAYSTAAVGVRFVAGKTADRLGENQIIPWGLSLVAGGLLLVPLVHGIFLLLVAGFIFGIGHGLLFPALNAMGVRDEAYEVRGKVTGIFTGGIDAGIFCGALILGSIGKVAGFTALFICSGLMVLCGLWLFRLRPANTTTGEH